MIERVPLTDLAKSFERVLRRAPVVVVGTLVGHNREVAVLADSEEASEDSIFEIGSITKTFTALLLAEMV